jgi:hypothetical protein
MVKVSMQLKGLIWPNKPKLKQIPIDRGERRLGAKEDIIGINQLKVKEQLSLNIIWTQSNSHIADSMTMHSIWREDRAANCQCGHGKHTSESCRPFHARHFIILCPPLPSLLLGRWESHDVSSPEKKIQFLPLSAGQIRVLRLIHILCLLGNQLFT